MGASTFNNTKNSTQPNGNYSAFSIKSTKTEETYLASSSVNHQYIDKNIFDHLNDGTSQTSLMNGHNSLTGSRTTISASLNDIDDDFCDIPSFIEFDQYKLIFQGEIGRVSL